MSETYKELQENLKKLIEESDNLELTMFTFELLDCIWCDIVEEDDVEVCEDLIEAYENEVRNSLEIMNPDLESDINVLEKVLNYMIVAGN